MDEQNQNDNINGQNEEDIETSEPQQEIPPAQPAPETQEPAPVDQPGEKESWSEVFHDKKLIYSTIGVFALVIALGVGAYFVFFPQRETIPAPEVALTIEKPAKVAAGQPFDFTVTYENKSERPLENVRLAFQFPQDYTWREASVEATDRNGRTYDLPDLEPGESGKVEVTGVIEGQVGDKKELIAALQYTSPPALTTYKTENRIDIEISASDLLLNVNGPTETVGGQEITYTVVYKNIGTRKLAGVTADVSWPSSFTVLETVPLLSENKEWYIGDIDVGQEGSLRIRGVYDKSTTGQNAVEVTAHEANTGVPLNKASIITQVGDSPLTVVQTISDDGDEVVLPGETLSYSISVTNHGDTAVTNAILSTELAGSAYNMSSIKATGGVLANSTITWTPGGASALKLLQPNDTATVTFSISIKDQPTSTGERNMTVLSSPSVTTFEYKEAIKGVEVLRKVKTKVDLKQQITHISGPKPMRVGQETRYRIDWTITNTTNTVANVSVTADMPLGQENVVTSSASGGTNLRLMPYTLSWDIGTLEAHTSKTASLTISFTPSAIETGTAPAFLSNITLNGTDMFVNQKVFDETPVLSAQPQDRVEP